MRRAIYFTRLAAYAAGIIGVLLFVAAKGTSDPYGTLGQAGMIGMITSTILLIVAYGLRMVAK